MPMKGTGSNNGRFQAVGESRRSLPAAHSSAPAEEMEAFEVSKDIGNVRNNSADVLNSK